MQKAARQVQAGGAIIHDELCHGIVRDASRTAYRRIVEGLQASGADGAILRCTEIALLIGAGDVPLPVFDTTALHAQTAVALANESAQASPAAAVSSD